MFAGKECYETDELNFGPLFDPSDPEPQIYQTTAEGLYIIRKEEVMANYGIYEEICGEEELTNAVFNEADKPTFTLSVYVETIEEDNSIELPEPRLIINYLYKGRKRQMVNLKSAFKMSFAEILLQEI